jgi:osmotically-inducible protein OsmY
MKMNPKPTVKCAGWMLLAAGAFGMSATARGQVSPYAPVARRPVPTYDAKELRPVSYRDASARLAEIKAELAWLGNTATFPFPLEARVVGSTLEIHGAVPNDLVRKQALSLARGASGLNVVDGLQIVRTMTIAHAKTSTDGLQRVVRDTLEQVLPQYAPNFTVNVLTNSQVLLRGSVPNFEDKLSASRCLRQVDGCASVINQLQVKLVRDRLDVPVVPVGTQTRARNERDSSSKQERLTPVNNQSAAAAGGGYVCDGVVFFDMSEPLPEHKQPSTPTSQYKALEERIALACGKAPKDVEITSIAEKNLVIRVKARADAEGQILANKILQLTELRPYQVSLEIAVMQ